MRIASRVVGVVLLIAGLVFVGLFIAGVLTLHPESVLEGPQWGRRVISALPALVFGAVFFFIRLVFPQPGRRQT